jgi:dipeptide/tripeptide permease
MNVTAVDLSVLSQIPGYFFLALGEILALITGMPFTEIHPAPQIFRTCLEIWGASSPNKFSTKLVRSENRQRDTVTTIDIIGLQFMDSQSPYTMRSTVVAVFYFTNALGNYFCMSKTVGSTFLNKERDDQLFSTHIDSRTSLVN